MTAIGSRLSVIGYRLSVIGYRLSSCFEWSSLVGWRSVMSYELWVFEVLGILDRHRSALAGMSYELWVIEFFWLMAPTALTGTFTYHRFHIPRAPTAPAMAPAARARPGGLGVKLAGPE